MVNAALEVGANYYLLVAATDLSQTASLRMTSYLDVIIDVKPNGRNPPQLLLPKTW